MPVVKHLTKRQKKRMKSRDSASANTNANENKSDKNQKKGGGGKNASAKQNQAANGAPPKDATGAVAVLERSPPRPLNPPTDLPGTTLALPEASAHGNQRNSYTSTSYRCNRFRYYNNQREESGRDQYYGRQPSNRVLGHLITAENYKRIQGAYERSRLWKLKRLQQANKRKREKQAAMAAAAAASAATASKLSKTESEEALPEDAAAGFELHIFGEPPESAAGAGEDERQMDLGPMSFQRYINGCIDWMFPSENTQEEEPPEEESAPTVNPIGSEMLAKKQRLFELANNADPRQDAEDAVLRMAMQMDALQLNAMSPDDLEQAVRASGLDVRELAKRPTERANWMCAAILNILNEPNKRWESEKDWEPGKCLPKPSTKFCAPDAHGRPLSASELHAEMDRALTQIAERPLSPIVDYPAQDEAAAMPPTFENSQMSEQERFSLQAQISMSPPPPPPAGGNRRAANNQHVRGRNYYRGGKGRSWQNQRNQQGQANRQNENTNNNQSRYGLYLQQSQFVENCNSNVEQQPNEMPPPVEAGHGMMPMGMPPVQNYGPYENMPPYAPMGPQLYPGFQPVADPAANFVAMPPPINQTNNNGNNFAPLMPMPMPMPMPMIQNIAANGNNVNAINAQQPQSQQQKLKKMGNKYSNWNAASPPAFSTFAGRVGEATYASNYAEPRVPEPQSDFTLSDNTHFPPLPVPLKTRRKKGRKSN